MLFLRDWAPLAVLLPIYEGLRDLVPLIGVPPRDLAGIDRALFGGQLPTLSLQRPFYDPQAISWQDCLATLVYFAHFLLPVGIGLFLWFADRAQYRRFTAALLTLCALAFITYVVMPTTPPWLGDPRGVHEVTDETIRKLSLPGSLVAIYVHHDYNLYAAFPSLHAAFPVVVAFYGWVHNRLLGLALAARAVLAWVSIVYLGEHYVVDILGGTLYAAVAILVVERSARHPLNRGARAAAGPVASRDTIPATGVVAVPAVNKTGKAALGSTPRSQLRRSGCSPAAPGGCR